MKISTQTLLDKAASNVGATDFGGDDFLVGLRVLIAAIEDAQLEPGVEEGLHAHIVGLLETRLRIAAHRRANPAIADEKIEAPLIVIGLPRTGTTALVDLLAQDPSARVLYQWESAHLFPPAAPGQWENDPRIAALDAHMQTDPALNRIMELGLHTFGARLPDECNAMLTLDFKSPNLSVAMHLPRYSQWLQFANYPQGYRLHREVLQQLQYHGRGGRWTLKSPFHVFDLNGLLAEYPDAVFVQTHREPQQLLASNCGLYATIRGEGDGDPRRFETGREVCELYGTGIRRALAARGDPALDERVFDISHRSMVDDPLGTLRSVYEHFDLPFGAEVEQRARRWIESPAQHMSAKKFTLAEFGLTADQVESAFAGYRARFAHLF